MFSVLHLSKLMTGRALAGHRFDADTPIAETVRESISRWYNLLTWLILRCKRFMMLFKLAMYATSECLPAGRGNVRCFSMSR